MIGVIHEVDPSYGISTELKQNWWLKIRIEEVLVESRKNFVIVWTHFYVLKIVFVIITWKTARQYLGRVWVGVNGTRGLYYWKHRTHTWIKESHKVTKKLVIDFVLFKYDVTIVSVMTKKNCCYPDPSGHITLSPTTMSRLHGSENQVWCSVRLKQNDWNQSNQ